MKKRKSLANGYTLKKRRREVLGFGTPREGWFKDVKNKSVNPFVCKCGRSIYDHPCLLIGPHYASLPYHGDLCPFIAIGERI